MISAKLNGLTPSKFVQQQMIRLGQLSTDACCEKADECQRTNWLLKATLERQLPPNVRAVMANIKFDGQETSTQSTKYRPMYSQAPLARQHHSSRPSPPWEQRESTVD